MRRLHLRFPGNQNFPVRHPFHVDPCGAWKQYTATVPKGCSIFGTITSNGSTGALIKLRLKGGLHREGNFCKVVNGQISVVNTLKVQQALEAYRERGLQEPLEMVSVEEFPD